VWPRAGALSQVETIGDERPEKDGDLRRISVAGGWFRRDAGHGRPFAPLACSGVRGESRGRRASSRGSQTGDGQTHYRGLVAEHWDLLRGDTSNWSSVLYFLALIREYGEPALDVASGTGRLLHAYLKEGVDIDGVDISPEMIDRVRENAQAAGLSQSLRSGHAGPRSNQEIPDDHRPVILLPAPHRQLRCRFHPNRFLTIWSRAAFSRCPCGSWMFARLTWTGSTPPSSRGIPSPRRFPFLRTTDSQMCALLRLQVRSRHRSGHELHRARQHALANPQQSLEPRRFARQRPSSLQDSA
jgi:hypothetical protein